MAPSAHWYGSAIQQAFGSGALAGTPNIDYLSDDIRVMLCTSAYVPSQDAHIFKSHITGEVVGVGYVAGGVSLTSKTLVYSPATKTLIFSAANLLWANSTITARFAVVYDNTPLADGSKPLLGYIDFGGDMASSNGNFAVAWGADGILSIAHE